MLNGFKDSPSNELHSAMRHSLAIAGMLELAQAQRKSLLGKRKPNAARVFALISYVDPWIVCHKKDSLYLDFKRLGFNAIQRELLDGFLEHRRKNWKYKHARLGEYCSLQII